MALHQKQIIVKLIKLHFDNWIPVLRTWMWMFLAQWLEITVAISRGQ